MKAGKIAESVLKRSVLRQLHTEPEEVLLGAAVGEDCAAIDLKDQNTVVLSSDPVFGSLEQPEELAKRVVWRAVNNLASAGAVPVGIMITVLFPTSANEPQLRTLMQKLSEACQAQKLVILGGHTEVTRAVNQPVITVTGVGPTQKDKLVRTSGVKPGMDIIATNWIALEGTVRIANAKEEELRTRYAQPFIDKAKKLEVYIPILSEAAVACMSGVSAMHDVSEGGIFAALWEMAEASGVGLEIDLKKIPLRQETVEICEFFGINPYKLVSGGCMLMAAADGNAIVREIEKAGGTASIIGKATDSNDRVLWNEDERRFLETPQTDEINKIGDLS